MVGLDFVKIQAEVQSKILSRTVFNLGGAGGVERLDTWEDTTVGNQRVRVMLGVPHE